MITKTLRFTLLALTATVVFSSCKGKNDTPTSSPDVPNVPNGKHAERKDVIGKVEQMTVYKHDKKGQVVSSSVVTYDRLLRPLTGTYSAFKEGKFVPGDYKTMSMILRGVLSFISMERLGSLDLRKGIPTIMVFL